LDGFSDFFKLLIGSLKPCSREISDSYKPSAGKLSISNWSSFWNFLIRSAYHHIFFLSMALFSAHSKLLANSSLVILHLNNI
jgi:hypothetical protein